MNSNGWDIELTWWEKLLSPITSVWYRLKEAHSDRRYRRQRAKQGWAVCDLWDMRDWFVKTLKPMLREMADRLVSYPEELSPEEWRAILLEMADCLETFDVWDETLARQKAGIALDEYSEDSDARITAVQHEAKDRFFELFEKWFYHLSI